MRKSPKIALAIASAGVVAAGASAFTASSTIDHSSKLVGATGQTISGVHVSNVTYSYDAGTDDTSGVSFHTAEVLGANDTLTVKLDGNAAESCTPTLATAPATGTDYACSWASPVHAATSLSIVVN